MGILDATVVLSFDRTGFRRHARKFVPGELDVRLDGKRCLVTGANSGIGRATALELLRRGGEVALLCRDPARGEGAARELAALVPGGRVEAHVVDVSDLASVRAVAPRFGRVDVLVHNAGVLPAARTLSPQGHEVTFATHVVGPWLLTRLLEPALAPGARVLFVSSGGMYTTRLSLEDLDWAMRPYDGTKAYAQTKRMQVVLAEVLAERLRGKAVVHSMHPGWADTPAVASSLPRFHALTKRILRTPEEGADTVVWLAVARRAGESSGQFWFDREPRRTEVLPGTREKPGDRAALVELVERATAAESPRASGPASEPAA